MSLGLGFTVWLPEVADGFPVYPYEFVTQDDLRGVAEYANGRQGWADVPFDKIADQCRAWTMRSVRYWEQLQVVAVAALAEITGGFIDSSDGYWGPLTPARPDEFVLRYTQTPPH